MAYYGVYIPSEARTNNDGESPFVYGDKTEALKTLKRHRECRLNIFKTRAEAEQFSLTGYDPSNAPTTPRGQNSSTNGESPGDSKATSPAQQTASPLTGEKSSFRGPTSQELVKFRKLIEQGRLEEVHQIAWSNPRFFISSGDTPTILKESFRYNALHVATISKNAKMCALILEIVSDPKFISLLHGKDDTRTAEDVSQIILDLYLNMPEKGRSETPLHLAAKFGVIEVVEVLTSYKECQMTRNSDGLLAKEIICTRNDSVSKETVEKIKELFEERFYVPVIRSVDNSMPPVVGEPFSPTQSIFSLVDPKSPDMEIKAIAGPMNKDQAETFRKRWKTPPRNVTSPFNSPHALKSPSTLSSLPNSIVRNRQTPIKSTPSKNSATPEIVNVDFEPTPRRLFNISLNHDDEKPSSETSEQFEDTHEFLAPMAPPVALSSAKKNLFLNYRERLLGGRLNESLDDSIASAQNNSFNDSVMDTPGFKERNLKLADVDKGLEVIGRCLAKDQKIGWQEYWSFLGEFTDLSTIDGLTKFEEYLKQRIDEKSNTPTRPAPKPFSSDRLMGGIESSPMSTLCRDINKVHLSRDIMKLNLPSGFSDQIPAFTPTNSPNAFHAYLCVEKSCQVFAKRLLQPICQQTNNVVMINDALTSDLSRLKSLVCSYKEDPRFVAIDFQATHSRFAHIIAVMLKESGAGDELRIADFRECLNQILQAKEKTCASNQHHNNNQPSSDNVSNAYQLICLIRFLRQRLGDMDHLISPETLTTERDCADVWSVEQRCDCTWFSVSSKTNRSIKRRSGHKLNDLQQLEMQLQHLAVNGNDNKYDDDDFMSCPQSEASDYESDDEQYFTCSSSFSSNATPPNEFHDSYERFDFNNFIFGEEPTKMDNDVLKALHEVDIDETAFPNVFQWFTALQNYTLEERNNFPPPLVNQCNAPSPAKLAASTSFSEINQAKRLFQSPIKEMSSKFQLKPSILTSKI